LQDKADQQRRASDAAAALQRLRGAHEALAERVEAVAASKQDASTSVCQEQLAAAVAQVCKGAACQTRITATSAVGELLSSTGVVNSVARLWRTSSTHSVQVVAASKGNIALLEGRVAAFEERQEGALQAKVDRGAAVSPAMLHEVVAEINQRIDIDAQVRLLLHARTQMAQVYV
jgi:hypothetical protein